jgi:hypothetical protein
VGKHQSLGQLYREEVSEAASGKVRLPPTLPGQGREKFRKSVESVGSNVARIATGIAGDYHAACCGDRAGEAKAEDDAPTFIYRQEEIFEAQVNRCHSPPIHWVYRADVMPRTANLNRDGLPHRCEHLLI